MGAPKNPKRLCEFWFPASHSLPGSPTFVRLALVAAAMADSLLAHRWPSPMASTHERTWELTQGDNFELCQFQLLRSRNHTIRDIDCQPLAASDTSLKLDTCVLMRTYSSKIGCWVHDRHWFEMMSHYVVF